MQCAAFKNDNFMQQTARNEVRTKFQVMPCWRALVDWCEAFTGCRVRHRAFRDKSRVLCGATVCLENSSCELHCT